MKRKRKPLNTPALHRFLLVAGVFLVASVLLLGSKPALLALPEETFRDWVLRIAANTNTQPADSVVLVDIDEASLGKVGAWPWRRAVVADLLETLVSDYRAKAVAVDVVFPEPGDADGDERIAVLAQHAPVVLSQVFDYSSRNNALKVGVLAGQTQLTNVQGQTQATGYIANHAAFAKAARVGNIGFEPDRDGNLRRAPFVIEFEGVAYPSLALATAMLANGLKPKPKLLVHNARIPFNKPLENYTVVPAHRVLGGTVNLELLENKVVFVGSSSLGLGDRVATPLGPQTSGVFAHIAVYEGLLQGYPTALQQSSTGVLLGFVWLIAMCGFTLARFNRQAATLNIAAIVLGGLVWVGIAAWLAANLVEASLGAPFVALVGLLLLLVPYDWQTTQARSKLLMKTLSHHISPALARELIDSGLPNPLAPRMAEITVLVADVENYTGQIAELPVEGVAELTRNILNIIGQAVMQNRGTVDKFTGDGGVAFWGAPVAMNDHADLAIQAGLNIHERVQRYNATQMKAGKPTLKVRIGIESGTVIVGDFGWSERAIYTAMGICMGTAARLEQLGKNYSENMIVGPNTVKSSRNFCFELIDRPVLRGLQQQIDIYRLKPPHRE